MAGTNLDDRDLMELLRGRVLFRTDLGTPANPPSGETFAKTHAIELGLTRSAFAWLKQIVKPEYLHMISQSSPADE